MVRLPTEGFMRSQFHSFPRFMTTYAARFAACALIVTAAATAHADVVNLSGGRVVRVTGVTTSGANATLALTSGGVMSVPSASIVSIEAEPVSASLCGASAFRCQDRAMLMLRRTQSESTAANVARQHVPAAATAAP
jgi:hypothetical protein